MIIAFSVGFLRLQSLDARNCSLASANTAAVPRLPGPIARRSVATGSTPAGAQPIRWPVVSTFAGKLTKWLRKARNSICSRRCFSLRRCFRYGPSVLHSRRLGASQVVRFQGNSSDIGSGFSGGNEASKVGLKYFSNDRGGLSQAPLCVAMIGLLLRSDAARYLLAGWNKSGANSFKLRRQDCHSCAVSGER